MSIIKNHHITFKKAPSSGGIDEWKTRLHKCKGITNLRIDVDHKDLFAEYDLQNCREEDIENCMIEVGFELEDNLMERLKRGWIHFTEVNEQSELKHKAPACCDMTEIEEKRKLKK